MVAVAIAHQKDADDDVRYTAAAPKWARARARPSQAGGRGRYSPEPQGKAEPAAPAAPPISFGGAHSDGAAATAALAILGEAATEKPSRCPMPKSWLPLLLYCKAYLLLLLPPPPPPLRCRKLGGCCKALAGAAGERRRRRRPFHCPRSRIPSQQEQGKTDRGRAGPSVNLVLNSPDCAERRGAERACGPSPFCRREPSSSPSPPLSYLK